MEFNAMPPCNLLGAQRRFGETCCIHQISTLWEAKITFHRNIGIHIPD